MAHEMNPDSHQRDSSSKIGMASIYLHEISENQRKDLKIDDILCLYLIDISEQVIVNFYKVISCTIQLLRNCINQMGFEVTTGIAPLDHTKPNECELKQSELS